MTGSQTSWVDSYFFALRSRPRISTLESRRSRSVVLNIAEGRARGGKAEQNHYRIAQGSAAEACTVLDVVDITGASEQQSKLRRVGAMLNKMSR